jgi:hypothetical protein
MARAMQKGTRSLAATGAAVLALAGPGAGLADAPPPVKSAPSQYVEVVPSAGGGRPGAPASAAIGRTSAPGSAVGAAADAVAAGGGHGALELGAVLLGVSLCLVGAAAWRRRHDPNG